MKKPLACAISTAVLGMASFALPTAVLAQGEEADEAIEEVVVTGSRIARASLESATPLQVLTAEDINLGAETNIGDYLNQLPALGQPLFNRTNSNFDINNSGVVNVDLRDLGIERTLTLVNGRRFVAGVPGSSAVDLNAIPSAMVERVEVITGGASAVYGSDAIAGVINFILKDDFEGVELSSRYEITDESDGEENDISLLIGANFDGGRGNATAYIGFTDQGAIFSRDRDISRIDAVSPAALNPRDTTLELFGQVKPFFSSFPLQGRFDAGVADDQGRRLTGFNYTFLSDGTLVDSFDTNGNNRAADGFNRSAFRTIAIPTERFLAATNIHYDLNDNVRAFFESTYSGIDTNAVLEPFPLDSDDVFQENADGGIPLAYENSNGDMISHPFMPAEILTVAQGNGIEGVRFRRRIAEFGPRTASNERQTFRFSTGLEGSTDGGWLWDASITYGRTTQSQISEGNIDTTAMRNALLSEADPDNPGQFRCVDAEARASGCVPVNVFGFNSISPEAVAYITADKSRNATIEQKVYQLNMSGDLFEMPSGPLQIAFGLERREEESRAINDTLTVRGLNSGNITPNVQGEFDVDEVYVEFNVPILSNQYVDYFGFGTAARHSSYSIPGVGDTTTFEGRFELKINDDWLLRTSAARAIRAPNIEELFDPGTETFAQVTDPCAGVTNTTPGTRAANCRSIPAIQSRIDSDPDGAFTLTQTELQGTGGLQGGNPFLFEETAETFTLGFAYTPTNLPDWLGATLAVDYWDIEIEDAIELVLRNNVLSLCYDDPDFQTDPDPQCDNITRFPLGNTQEGALDQVNAFEENLSSIEAKGVDVDFQLSFDLDVLGLPVPGELSIGTVYTHVDDYNIVNAPGARVDIEDGEIGSASHKWNSNIRYNWDNLSMQWQVRFIGESRIEDGDIPSSGCRQRNCFVDEIYYSDFQLRYRLPGSLAGANLELFGGIENVFDEDPPVISAGLSDSDTGTETTAGVYDAIGRAWYLGFKASF
ncbi:TonB-dependent receptor [Exilibacterium tricleocarpae]|uniref:TonB-dependent receptor n=2 Tax=Exilibacterium tricleocarpae TaxID=2591008 RepID=A0A545U724_9GAMM|nr:TonB-dependent receptor [Exilibacterium tricleocarpae]